MPTARNAAGHPKRSSSHATSGGASMAPKAEPLLKMPLASARSRSGNHSATTLTPPGQLPASPIPSRNRNAPRLQGPVAKACSTAAPDHQTMQRA